MFSSIHRFTSATRLRGTKMISSGARATLWFASASATKRFRSTVRIIMVLSGRRRSTTTWFIRASGRSPPARVTASNGEPRGGRG